MHHGQPRRPRHVGHAPSEKMTELRGRDRAESWVATGRSFGSGLSASRQNRRSARCRRRRPCARCRIQDRELGKQHILRHECTAFGGISVEQQGPLAVTHQNDPCRCEFHGRDCAGRRAGGLRWPQPIALAGSIDDRDGYDRPLAEPVHAGVGRNDAARGANIERICVTTTTSGIRCDIGLPGEQESRRTREPRCELNHRTFSTPRKAPVFHVRMSTLSVVLKRQQSGEVPRAEIAHDATAPAPQIFFEKIRVGSEPIGDVRIDAPTGRHPSPPRVRPADLKRGQNRPRFFLRTRRRYHA